jgi:hypothetical protein
VIDTSVIFETLYTDLKRLAQKQLRGLPAGRTLHATVLVHEVYLRFLGNEPRNAAQSCKTFLNPNPTKSKLSSTRSS